MPKYAITKAPFFDLAYTIFWQERYPFQTPNWAELRTPNPGIPDSTGKNFPDSGIRHVWPDSPKIISKVTKFTSYKNGRN